MISHYKSIFHGQDQLSVKTTRVLEQLVVCPTPFTDLVVFVRRGRKW